MNRFIFVCLAIVTSINFKAQEGLRPLHANLSYVYKTVEHASIIQHTQIEKASVASLFLPFKEDFYYAYQNKYPNQTLWQDSNVYVNTTYPIAPPNIGVATFDGLNKRGYPYTPNQTNLSLSSSADTLTSRPINLAVTATSQSLQVSDNIALTFYYQARGNGEAPEANDNLYVDFYMPASNTWTNVWSQAGNSNSNTNDTIFKRAFIWIDTIAYLKDGFKFRIRNSATTCGDFDHWHIDYIYLDKNRNLLGDTLYNDLSFANTPTPFLKSYSSMPYQQYNSSEMADKISVRIKNNSATKINYAYDLSIYNSLAQQLHTYSGGFKNLCPFKPSNVSGCNGTSGYCTEQAHSNPTFNYTFATLSDSTDFTIKHMLTPNGSTVSGNPAEFFTADDSIFQYQKFRNYFALDDGSAEGGYYVNAIGGKMAMKFKLNYFDTLQAVRIYFDPVGLLPLAQTDYKFNIILWTDGGNGPGSIIFTDTIMLPKYFNSGHKEIPEFQLKVSKGLRRLGPGTYYVGFQQKVATGITVGFDKNINHSSSLYYDSGTGWTQSIIPGSIMIHPVFGKKIPSLSAIEENKFKQEFLVYPNPSNNLLHLMTEKYGDYNYTITDALGRTLLISEFNNNETSINTSPLSNGIYFLNVFTNQQNIHQQKIIVQH